MDLQTLDTCIVALDAEYTDLGLTLMISSASVLKAVTLYQGNHDMKYNILVIEFSGI